jgi:hypothetical protein
MPPRQIQQTEFDVVLKDEITPGLRAIARELQEMNRIAKTVAVEGGVSFEQFGRQGTQASEATKRITQEFTALGSYMTGFSKSLLAAGGVAYAIEYTSKALKDFVGSRVQLELFSREVKFSTGYISIMERTMSRMGLTTDQITEYTKNYSDALQELAATGVGSKLFKDLQLIGETDFAGKLLKVVQSGDFDTAHQMLIQKLGRVGSSALWYLSKNSIGVPDSVTQSWAEYAAGVKAAYDASYKHSKEYYENLESVRNAMRTAWGETAEFVIDKLNRLNLSMQAAFSGLDEKLKKNPDLFHEELTEKFGEPPEALGWLRDWLTGNTAMDQIYRLQQQTGTEPTFARMGNTPPGGTGPYSPNAFGGSYTGGGGVFAPFAQAQEQGLHILQQARDALKRIEDAIFQSGQGAAGISPGDARSILGGRAASRPGGVPPISGLHGGGPGADPRNKIDLIRTEAIKNGIDPDVAVAVAAREGLTGFYGDGNTSFGAFQLHVGGGLGDVFKKETGLDPSDPKNEDETIKWALKYVGKTRDWSPWHGAPYAGVRGSMGTGLDPAALAEKEKTRKARELLTPTPSGGISSSPYVIEDQAGAKRHGPLNPQERAMLAGAAEAAGVRVQVYSGSEVPGGWHSGSGRHMHGNTADFHLLDEDGKQININDPRALKFVEEAGKRGALSGGAAAGYMGEYSMDLGIVPSGGGTGAYTGSKQFREAFARGIAGRPAFEAQQAQARADMDRAAAIWQASKMARRHTTNVDVTFGGGLGRAREFKKEADVPFVPLKINREPQAPKTSPPAPTDHDSFKDRFWPG